MPHKLKKDDSNDLFSSYEQQLKAMEKYMDVPSEEKEDEEEPEEVMMLPTHPMMAQQMPYQGYPSRFVPFQQQYSYQVPVYLKKKKSGKHKKKKKAKDPLESYEAELKAMEEFMPEVPEEETEGKGIHRLTIDPEKIPLEEGDWLERQQKEWERQAKEFEELAESGKKFAIGTYETVDKAWQKASEVGSNIGRWFRRAKRKLGRKFGKHKMKRPPVQVFVEPTEEGDYVVYGQFKKEKVKVKRPTKPVKVAPHVKSKGDEVVYGDW